MGLFAIPFFNCCMKLKTFTSKCRCVLQYLIFKHHIVPRGYLKNNLYYVYPIKVMLLI